MKSPSSQSPSQAVGATIRIGLTVDDIKRAFRDNLVCGMGRLRPLDSRLLRICMEGAAWPGESMSPLLKEIHSIPFT